VNPANGVLVMVCEMSGMYGYLLGALNRDERYAHVFGRRQGIEGQNTCMICVSLLLYFSFANTDART